MLEICGINKTFNPGTVNANHALKLEFGGESPLTMRYELRWSNKVISRPVARFRSAHGIRQT